VVGLLVEEQVVSGSAMRGDALRVNGGAEKILLLASFWHSDFCVVLSGSGEASSRLL